MKRITALLLAVAMLLTLGACGKKDEEKPAANPTEVSTLAENFIKAYYLRDYVTQFSMYLYDARKQWEDKAIEDVGSAKKFFELAQKQADDKGIDVTVTSFDSYYEAYRQFILEDCRNLYGEYKLTTTATGVTKLTEEELPHFRNELLIGPSKEYMDEKTLNAIDEVYIVIVNISVDGEKRDYNENYRVYVVNHNGKWLVADHSM